MTLVRFTQSTRLPPRLLAGAVLFYAALAFLVLYAIVFTTHTHTAGYDFFNYHWNFWWVRHASTTPGLNIYLNDFAMFPAMSNYGYHALAAFWYPVWALTEPLIGTLGSVNAIIVLVCFLNGFILFLWLMDEGMVPLFALIGGVVLTTMPITRYFYYNSHLNLMDWFWLPALLLMWKRLTTAAHRRRFRQLAIWIILFGIALWGLLLTDLQFPIFAAFLLVPYGVRALWLASGRERILLIGAGVLAVALAVVLMGVAGPLGWIARFESSFAPSPVEDRPGIPFPEGFLSMASGWWNWNEPTTGAFVTLYIAAAVAVSIIYRRVQSIARPRQDRWFWFTVMLPPLVFSLGPTLSMGEAMLPLPFRALYALTNGNFRMPWRLAPVVVVAGMTFAGLTLTPLLRASTAARRVRWATFGATAMLLALSISVRLYESAPLQPVPPRYAAYERMGEEHGDYVVLEVPTAAGTGEVLLGDPRAIQLQWYGITHGKRMVNGFISRAPVDQFYYLVTDDPMMAWLGQRRPLEHERVREQLAERIDGYPIGYIVIHKALIERDSPTLQEMIGFFNRQDDLICPYAIEGDNAGIIVYRTRAHPDGCGLNGRLLSEDARGYRIDIGAETDAAYMGWGWHWAETVSGLTLRWTGEYPETWLYADLPAQDYTLHISAQSFWEARQLQIAINGMRLAETAVVTPDALNEYTFTVPAAVLGDGQHVEITLEYDAVVVPREVGQSADARRLAIAVDWIRFDFAR